MFRTTFAASVGSLVGVLLMVCSSQESRAQAVRVRNGMDQPVYLWIWQEAQPGVERGWRKPVPHITPTRPISIHLPHQGEYQVVVRDEAGNDDPIGPVNIGRILEAQPDAVLLIAGGYKTAARTEQYNVTIHRPVMQTRMETVWDGHGWRQRKMTYQVWIPETETRTRQVNAVVFDAELYVEYDGRIVSVDHFRNEDDGIMDAMPRYEIRSTVPY